MYPLPEGYTYPRNQWWIAAVSDEVNRDIFERKILGENIVFYRTEAGQPVAMQANCPHRHYPLAKSKLVGDSIQCGYHGFTYGSDGGCKLIPSQEKIPAKCRTRVYPTAERWKWVWIWMGDPALADESKIPAPYCIDQPGWRATQAKTMAVKSRYSLALDNLFDLSHLGFIHSSYVGELNEVVRTPVEMTEVNGIVRMVRHVKNAPYTPYEEFLFGPGDGLVDSDVYSDYYGPCLVITGGPFNRAKSHYAEHETPQHYGEIAWLHGITPETENTAFYFGGLAHNFRTDDEEFVNVNVIMYDGLRQQDEDALELVEAGLQFVDRPDDEVSVAQDVGGVRIRRLLTEQIKNEIS